MLSRDSCVVELSQSNLRQGETHGSCNRHYDTDPGPVIDSIYLMSKPRLEYCAFFRFMPSVHTYYEILKAIEKLKIESLVVKDMETMQAMGKTVLTKQNRGFRDIVALLRRNQCIPPKANVTELRYWESCDLKKPPPFGLHLKCLNATVNGEDKFLLGTFDALHQLKEMADIYVRGRITTFIVLLASVFFLLSILLAVYTIR